MRNFVKPFLITLRNIAILAIIYSALIFLIVYFLPSIKEPWYDSFKLMNSPSFYIGLTLVIILGTLYSPPFKRLGDKAKGLRAKINRYIQLGVPIVILLLGVFVMWSSYNKSIWENLSYDLSAFGVGVSMTALGFSFLLAAYPSKSKQTDNKSPASKASEKLEVDTSNLSTKIETLNKKLDEAKKTIDAFLEGSQKLGKRLTAKQRNERGKR
jgi:hypothetical protein